MYIIWFALGLNLDEAVMESGNSDPEMYITQSSPQRKRTFPTLDVLCEDTLASDEDIWALAGDINEVEEQPSATGFDRFAAPVAKIDDCVPKLTRTRISGLLHCCESIQENFRGKCSLADTNLPLFVF